jgi:diguanylate cyclase (GGDEF)-like protein/PAS domain S-box-containing protein
MIKGGRLLARRRTKWFRAALQPAILPCVLMIPAMWLSLVAVAHLAAHDIFASHNRLQLILFAAACTLTAVLVVGFFVSIRHRMRLDERETLIARQKVHLDCALANMPEGLCMFDADQQLIVCNQQYADLYELSKEQTRPGTFLRSILEHHHTAGNVPGDRDKFIARRLNLIAAGKTYQHINKLRDGRLILVTHQPMDDGGWVATHKDVTEQVSHEESIRLLFEGSPVPMWVSERDSLRFLAVNDAAVARYGYSREQFLTMTVPQLRPDADRERFGNFLRTLEPSQFAGNIGQHITSDGTLIDVSVSSRALTYAGHNARLTVIHDISQSKQAERELRRTQKFLDAIIEHVPVPILVKDVANAGGDIAQCRYTLVNRSFEELFGIPRANIVGKTVTELYPKERADFIIAENTEALNSPNPIALSDHEVHTATNGVRVCTATTVAVRDDAQSPQILVTVLQDVTERNRTEQRIARMAHHDHLTNIANRKTFNDTLEAMIARATDCGDQFTILSLDLDGFKETNDTYGHLVGDALLCEVSRRLLHAAGNAFVARIGGDEFALIVEGGSQIAAPLADRLLEAFREEIRLEGRRIKSGATIGAAVYPNHGSDSKTLISNADVALYRAKAEVRGTALFFDPKMGEEVRERRALQEALRSAVECQQLRLHYQPQKTMSGATMGFEALARWRDRHHGSVSPDVFVPIAEECGLIVAMGEWVLREACREAATWRHPLTIAVNVSPLQFRYGDLPHLVHSILLDTGLAPARLELEITENVFIDDFSRAISVLSRLKALGVRVALDDFGSGYSSLSYLHSFAFDKIKIDRTFILDLEHNQHSMAIVRAVIDLGHSLNIPVMAEGVETAAQHAMLVERGCDEVQGYLVGRPAPIEDYAELVGSGLVVRAKASLAG